MSQSDRLSCSVVTKIPQFSKDDDNGKVDILFILRVCSGSLGRDRGKHFLFMVVAHGVKLTEPPPSGILLVMRKVEKGIYVW